MNGPTEFEFSTPLKVTRLERPEWARVILANDSVQKLPSGERAQLAFNADAINSNALVSAFLNFGRNHAVQIASVKVEGNSLIADVFGLPADVSLLTEISGIVTITVSAAKVFKGYDAILFQSWAIQSAKVIQINNPQE